MLHVDFILNVYLVFFFRALKLILSEGVSSRPTTPEPNDRNLSSRGVLYSHSSYFIIEDNAYFKFGGIGGIAFCQMLSFLILFFLFYHSSIL